jgi:hypothetical protein
MNKAAVQEGASPDQLIIQMATGYMVSAALYAVARLDIAEQLASGPRPVSDLAAATHTNEDVLYRTLRALASVGIFTESAPRTFALTPAADLLRASTRGNVRDMVTFISDPFHFRVYAEMLYSVQTGKPAGEKVTGMPVFEYLTQDKDESDSFNNAMTSLSAWIIPAVLDAYDFSGIRTLVDVAGGHGEVVMSILRRYPELRGVLFDQQHVVEGAIPRIAAAGLQQRCTVEAGDFFKGVPARGDTYLMKHIIHDWDDERAMTILNNIRAALRGQPNGRLVLLESVVRAGNEPDLSKLMDLEMFLLPGGRERTTEEFAALFAGAGFALAGVTPTESPVCVIEARPV